MKKIHALLSLAAAVGLSATASAQFTVSGPGGPIPTMDTGNSGDRCDVLPNDFNVFPATSTVPADATCITSVELIGLNHTWVGDVQIVLRDPNGAGYNLISRLNTDTATCGGFGDSSNWGGDYTILPSADPAAGDMLAEAVAQTGASILTPGTYRQFYGVWNDGSAGVSNVDLSGIPAIPGTWSLEIYDGATGDTGDLVEWRMNGDTQPGGATSYSGGGGLIPAAGSGGGGNRCDTLPDGMNMFPLTSPVMGGSSIESVELSGLNHTWVGDVQVVLRDPNGAGYNLINRLGTSTSCSSAGDSSDFGGTYTIVPAGTGGGDLLAEASAQTGSGIMTPGSYEQYYGLWVDGSAGVSNVDLASIPVVDGTWVLEIYDGAGGDTGDIAGWTMNIAGSPAAPVCPADPNSTGVPTQLSFSGSNSIAANDLMMHVTDAPANQFGIFIVGGTRVNMPGLGQGTLCVGDPQRGLGNAIVNTGAGGAVSLAADLQNLPVPGGGFPSGVPAMPNQKLYIQFWHRDIVGGMATFNFSNASVVVPVM